MKALVQEYGLMVVAIICVGVFLFIWSNVFFGKTGVTFVYKTWSPEISNIESNGDSVSQIVTKGNKVPYFDITRTNFSIDENTYTRSKFLNGINARYADGSLIDSNDIVVIVYKYTPLMADEALGVNGHVMMTGEYVERYGYDALVSLSETGNYTEVFAVDKYGNYLYDEFGKRIVSSQPIYLISKGKILGNSDYIDTSDPSEKYKVVYRVKSGQLKAEYETFFVKTGVSSNTDNLSGYTKVDFNYDIDDSPVRVDEGEGTD